MSEEENLLELVLDKFSKIKEALHGTKDIKKFLKKSKLNKREDVDVILGKAKKLVDSLYDQSVNVKEEFYSKYKSLDSSIKEKDNECHDSSVEENVCNVEPPTNNKDMEIENSVEEKVSNECIEERNEVPIGSSEDVENDLSNSNIEDPLRELDTSNKINDDTTDKSDSEEKAQKESSSSEDKSSIRLVDLSKLIDPKPKKSVQFDSSIIILTSSDEESPKSKKKSTSLKQTLVDNKKVQNKNAVNGETDFESRENLADRNSEESDPDSVKKYTEKLKRTTRQKDAEIGDNSELEDVELDETKEKGSRKSSRIHKKEISKRAENVRLRKLLNHRSHKSLTSGQKKPSHQDSNSDSDVESVKKTPQKDHGKKRERDHHLSDTSSSLSSTEVATKGNNKHKRTKSNDASSVTCDDIDTKHFKADVYVPLPRIECYRLEEAYLKNKEVLEKNRTESDSLRNQSSNKNVIKESSEDGDKFENKKSKNRTETSTSGDEISSDDEPLKKLGSTEIKAMEIEQRKCENAKNIDELIVDILPDEFKETDTDKEESVSKGGELEEECEKENGNQNDEKGPKTGEENEDIETNKNSETLKEKLSDSENLEEKDIEKDESKDKENDGEDIENKNESDNADDQDSDMEKDNENDKIVTLRIDSTDSEEEFNVRPKKKVDSRKLKKRVRKAVVSSDSEGSNKDSKKESSDDSADSDKSDKEEPKSDEELKRKPTRKRIRGAKNSSSSDEDKSTRKHIRRVIGQDSLSETTKMAEAEEKERKARIAEKQRKYNQLFESSAESKVDKVVLDYDEKNDKEVLALDKKIVKKLKPHQASGIRFMWDACFESVKRATSTKGSGCILAHCMGLGKTLQVIALAQTLLTNVEQTGVHKIMVVCPINTVLNWKSEFKKWIPKQDEFEVHELVSCKQNYERQYVVQEWHNDGGVLIIGYSMFRNLSNPDNKRITKKMRTTFQEGLVDPGPDMVVCDEGHLLKNEKTHLSIAMNRIKTARRIVLTGTPLQNNLKEYWCMVQFIKPNLLGTYKEYLNRFVNPIINGQYTDSTQHDILVMRKRSHVLHKLLDGVVQRRDYAVLEPYLPPKHEYVLFIQLTETQVNLYKHYMDKLARQSDGSNRTSFLFADFQHLQRICTHPRVLLDRSVERKQKESEGEESEGSLKDFIDDGDESSAESTDGSSSESNSNSDGSVKKGNKSKGKQQRTRVTRAQAAQRRENNEEESEPEIEVVKKEWFQEYCDGEELDNINNSGKLFLLFEILKECEQIGDKVLVFSQSLYTLNCIEYFLEKIDEATQQGTTEKVGGHSGSWAIGLDYFRLDGSSSCDNRALWCDMFNNPSNLRARLFLISTKAGGLGINLVAANRVIIFDVSWNPSHDIQSIYRVYRFGQTKPCYIYRFVTFGAMEMKIYERQVTKQAISKRVIDEQQIDRHYNQNDLQELYKSNLEPTDRPVPMVPKDVLLAELLQKYENTIYKYHLHQSLLENKEEEGLNEEERKAAWEEFENEKVLRKNTGFGLGFNANAKINAQAIETALASIVRKDNPTWSEVQVRGIIPALVQQLQVQLAEGDTTMYVRVQKEIQFLQEVHAQKLREAFYQQQMMHMLQKQQAQAKMLGNLYVDPAELARAHVGNFNMFGGNMMNAGGPSTAPRSVSNDVIELND